MSSRKLWQKPLVKTKSVSEALGVGETAGPMAPGLLGGIFGPPGSIAGSSGDDFFAGAEAVSGPPTRSSLSGPALGPSGRLPNFGPAGSIATLMGPPTFISSYGPPVQESDIRLKEDIAPAGTSAKGFPLYTFRYRGREGVYQGVMAQDILKTRPDAVVVNDDGFYMVDYAKLGIEFRRVG